jgi:hypothetical protein
VEEVEAMSQAVSLFREASYGLVRVCRTWRVSRATVYRHRVKDELRPVLGKRGHKTLWTDEELLALIHETWPPPSGCVKATGDWAARYNGSWLIERHGFLTPTQARKNFEEAAQAG